MRKQIALGAAAGFGFLLTAAGGCGKTEGSAPVDAGADVVPSDTCKSNYANDDLCIESGCGACSTTDFSSCAVAQSTDPTTTCLSENPLDHDCQAAISAVSQADADARCGASTTIATDADFDDVFKLIAKTLCE